MRVDERSNPTRHLCKRIDKPAKSAIALSRLPFFTGYLAIIGFLLGIILNGMCSLRTGIAQGNG